MQILVAGCRSPVCRLTSDVGSGTGDWPADLCTGPSKTADVEGILIEGVHGPGEQVARIRAFGAP